MVWLVIRENVDAVNAQHTKAVTEKNPEDEPHTNAEKVKEGAENEEEEKEAEDKVYFLSLRSSGCFALCIVMSI